MTTMRGRDTLITGLFVAGVAVALFVRLQTVGWPDSAWSDRRRANVVKTLDPNIATAGQLTIISGIGPAKAQAIVDYRDEIRSAHQTETTAYERAEDLQKVHGIGPRTVEKLRGCVRSRDIADKDGNWQGVPDPWRGMLIPAT